MGNQAPILGKTLPNDVKTAPVCLLGFERKDSRLLYLDWLSQGFNFYAFITFKIYLIYLLSYTYFPLSLTSISCLHCTLSMRNVLIIINN